MRVMTSTVTGPNRNAARSANRRGRATRWSASVEELGELVQGGLVAGRGMLACRRWEGTVAQRHARPPAVVVELDAHNGGVVHPGLRHRVRAEDNQLELDELDDLVADREFRAAAAWDHRELPAPAEAQVDPDPVARRLHVLRAVPGRHILWIGPGPEHPLARCIENTRDPDPLAGRYVHRVTHPSLLSGADARPVGPSGFPRSAGATASIPPPLRAAQPASGWAATGPRARGR